MIRLLLLAPPDSVAAAIAASLIADDTYVAANGDGDADAVLLDGMDAATQAPFLDLADDAFAAQAIDLTLERIVALQRALPRIAAPGSIVVIGSDAYLGRWHATGQAAASAALVGTMRSVAMEHARRGIRANLLALPLGTTPADTATIADAATQARALFAMPSVTGQTILLDAGANLKFRQARRR